MRTSLLFLSNDAKILQQLQQGDEEALVTLYEANRHMIGDFLSRNNGTEDDTDDMLQEALVILWERVRSGRFDHRAQLSTFIFATVKNIWLQRLARKKKEKRTDIDLNATIDTGQDALERLIECEETAIVREALDRIGDPCKTLLLLFYWEERPMQEIARHMGFANADTVKSKKYQCKKELKKILLHLQE